MIYILANSVKIRYQKENGESIFIKFDFYKNIFSQTITDIKFNWQSLISQTKYKHKMVDIKILFQRQKSR